MELLSFEDAKPQLQATEADGVAASEGEWGSARLVCEQFRGFAS